MAQRKRHTPEFKPKFALEALREQKTINQIASKYEVHAAQVSQWKKQALEKIADGFRAKGQKKKARAQEEELFGQIGQLKVELDWLKKISNPLRQIDGNVQSCLMG